MMNIVPITDENARIFEIFEQDYESEFSALTLKEPNSEGRFEIEVDWRAPNQGFFLYVDDKPAGFAVHQMIANRSDLGEFYILPCFRKHGYGKAFAFHLFDMFPGQWQVRQILPAKNATAFWRRVVEEYTDGNYTEDIAPDPDWERVTRQLFSSRKQD